MKVIGKITNTWILVIRATSIGRSNGVGAELWFRDVLTAK